MPATLDFETIFDLQRHLGGVPARRIRLKPTPGTATERDLIRTLDHSNRVCELVDGTLVEKPMGYRESSVTARLNTFLGVYLLDHDLGNLATADGAHRLYPGLVRLPDLSFVSWDRLPGRIVPDEAVLELAPDLAVEVVSAGNTRREMERKLNEYFDAGVQEVWMVNHRQRTVTVYSSPSDSVILHEDDMLAGGHIFPGFKLPLKKLFGRLPPLKKKKKR